MSPGTLQTAMLRVLSTRTAPCGSEILDRELTRAGVEQATFTGGLLMPALHALEAAGFVARARTGPKPYHVGYAITDAGREWLDTLAGATAAV